MARLADAVPGAEEIDWELVYQSRSGAPEPAVARAGHQRCAPGARRQARRGDRAGGVHERPHGGALGPRHRGDGDPRPRSACARCERGHPASTRRSSRASSTSSSSGSTARAPRIDRMSPASDRGSTSAGPAAARTSAPDSSPLRQDWPRERGTRVEWSRSGRIETCRRRWRIETPPRRHPELRARRRRRPRRSPRVSARTSSSRSRPTGTAIRRRRSTRSAVPGCSSRHCATRSCATRST